MSHRLTIFWGRVKGALQWFENFDEDMRARRLPRVAANRKNVIKIAVLDTGIKLEIASMSQRERRIQCWPSKTDCEDTDGHGTHVAHLLLLLAPHAHLRICKVSKTRLFTDVNIKQIADVSGNSNCSDMKFD
jgi:hypothetical protein